MGNFKERIVDINQPVGLLFKWEFRSKNINGLHLYWHLQQ